jgi:hypothetical protein
MTGVLFLQRGELTWRIISAISFIVAGSIALFALVKMIEIFG